MCGNASHALTMAITIYTLIGVYFAVVEVEEGNWSRKLIIIGSMGLHAMAVWGCPGKVGTGRYPYDNAVYCEGKWCDACGVVKEARSKHCYVCRRCVPRFDHHCVWVNNDIGRDNMRVFLAFLVVKLFVCVYGVYLVWCSVYYHACLYSPKHLCSISNFHITTSLVTGTFSYINPKGTRSTSLIRMARSQNALNDYFHTPTGAVTLVLLPTCAVFTVLVLLLLLSTLSGVVLNETAYESHKKAQLRMQHAKNVYYTSVVGNFVDAICPRKHPAADKLV